MTPLTPIQLSSLATIRATIARYGIEAWLYPSYVMAHCRIESGWDPTIRARDYATTGSVGLMQVERATVEQLIHDYGLPATAIDQTVPENSLLLGIAALKWTRQYLMNRWGFQKTILYKPVCEAYNEGVGNVIKGRKDEAYYLKWTYAQQCYGFVDGGL
jgi:soluble lytic murein transglycosylase-like protein